MRLRRSSLVISSLLVAVSCGPDEDPRLERLTVGIDRDSVLRVLGNGSTAADSTPNVYRKEAYLLDGKLTEILFFSPDGAREGSGEPVAEASLRPIVLQTNILTGWGWAYFDSLARIHDIRVRMR